MKVFLIKYTCYRKEVYIKRLLLLNETACNYQVSEIKPKNEGNKRDLGDEPEDRLAKRKKREEDDRK